MTNTIMLVPSPLAQRLLNSITNLEHLPRGATVGDMLQLVGDLQGCKSIDQTELAKLASDKTEPA